LNGTKTQYEFVGSAVLGTAIRPITRNTFDLVDLRSIVDHHERLHVEDAWNADSNPTNLGRRIVLNVSNQYFDPAVVPLPDRNDTDRDHAVAAANIFLGYFMEVRAYHAQLKAALTDNATSWRLVDSLTRGLAVSWNDLLTNIQPDNGLNLPVSKKLLTIRDPERGEVITLLQGLYDELASTDVVVRDGETVKGALEPFFSGSINIDKAIIPGARLSMAIPRIGKPKVGDN
jgi:hypothetical protein